MYDATAKAAVIFLKAEGKSDRAIGRMGKLVMPDGSEVKLPSRDTIEEWNNPESEYYDPAFSRQYTRACEDNLWDEHAKLHDINAQVLNAQLEPQMAKVVSDNIKWDLSRRLRHVFGDKLDVTSKDKELKGTVIVVASADDKELLEKI